MYRKLTAAAIAALETAALGRLPQTRSSWYAEPLMAELLGGAKLGAGRG
jgi:hypothetical protein